MTEVILIKILYGLIIWSVLGLILSSVNSMVNMKVKKEEINQHTGTAIFGLIWLVFYIMLIWYWIDLLGDVVEI